VEPDENVGYQFFLNRTELTSKFKNPQFGFENWVRQFVDGFSHCLIYFPSQYDQQSKHFSSTCLSHLGWQL